MNWKEILNRLRNVGTLTAVVTGLGYLLIQFGVEVDIPWLERTLQIVCTLGVLLGIFNNPTTKGADVKVLFKKQ